MAINADLNNIREWLLSNRLSFNLVKTEYLLIASRHNINTLEEQPRVLLGMNQLKGFKLQKLFLPRPNTEYGRKCFRYSGVKIWNSIPEQVRNSESLNSFNRNISSVSLTN